MKVLLITHNIEPTSGWGRYSLEVLRGLQKKEIDTLSLLEEGTSEITLFPTTSFFNFVYNIFTVRKAARSCEIVHALDGWPYGVYGFFAVVGTQKKLFINGVGTYSVAPLYSFIKGKLLCMAYNRAKKVFCISAYTKNQIAKKISARNLSVVHLGSTKLPIPSEEIISSLRERYMLATANPIFTTVGQIKDRKGQYETLQAVKLLKKKFPSICYLIVGSDSDQTYVAHIRSFIKENNMENNVRIIPDIKEDIELSGIYVLSNIVFLNSNNDKHHFEGFGLVLLEANQFWKPVIGSRNSGIEDAIQDGYNGLLTEQRDPADIAQKVLSIMDSYDSFSLHSKEFEKRFLWEHTIEAYIKGYQLDN